MKSFFCLTIAALFVGCAGTGAPRPSVKGKDSPTNSAAVSKARTAETVNLEGRPKGTVALDFRNVVNEGLDGRVDLMSLEGAALRGIEVKGGKALSEQPEGDYRVYCYVYDTGVPVLAQVSDLKVTGGKTATLGMNLLEGASGSVSLRAFDSDGDLAIDRVELECGTDPYNAASMPGKAQIALPNQVLRPESGWYKGDLHTFSTYGGGTESVAELVRRAENSGLDFLAITDRNTLAAMNDPGFKSNKVALIPAMEWGANEQGVALVYGPATMLDAPSSAAAAQAECIRVQAQGGLFAIAHPCLPTAPWQWGLSYINAVEVWCRDWRSSPPVALQQLREDVKTRKDGKLVNSIAVAAGATNYGDLSANAQACMFWDNEMNLGLMAAALGGSTSGNKRVPLGRPMTVVHARDLSPAGIIEGLRMGRTYVTCAADGPELMFAADALNDGSMDVGIGGVLPLNVDISFIASVHNALGKKLQVLENGRPIRTVPINAEDVAIRFLRRPTLYSNYRLRVIGAADPKTKGFGPVEVFALSSPIYAQDITQELLWRNPNLDTSKTWVRVQSQNVVEIDLPEDDANITPPGAK